MDRIAAMLILLGVLVSMVLFLLALFALSPVFCSCLVSLLYTLYLFLANEEHGVHHAQEFENRFWTIFAVLFSTALFFAKDSPIAFGRWSPSLGFLCVVLAGYGVHIWDRHVHRIYMSRQLSLRRNTTAMSSLTRLNDLGIRVEDQLMNINSALADIDQLLIPSTINNFINLRFVMSKERDIINIFGECDARALNYLISHVKVGLLFYKVKDHRNFSGQHRTELIQLLCVDRLVILTVMSRVIILHALQLMKLRANQRAEYWVRNILLNTHQDQLSELKSYMDAKGDYFSMNKLIYDDIRSETVRQDILTHIRKEAAIQQAHVQMGTRKAKFRMEQAAWRKVLSDVDDTLSCSGGSYPAGIDKRFGKKVIYPGVLAFYRELDLGTKGPEEWNESRIGNLVFLSARPHVYKDASEKMSFAKFERLRSSNENGRTEMHTVPSLLAGDIASGREYMMKNDMEPLAVKKFENFKRYVSIYPEFTHVFVCDNGQGDVRAGEMMFDGFPYEFEALFVHVVQDIHKTHGYDPERWYEKGLNPCFFRTYPEAALFAATRHPPMIRVTGLRRVCVDSVKDFRSIQGKQWPSMVHKMERRAELNQSIWRVNQYLEMRGLEPVERIEAEQLWKDGQKVRTPFGVAKIVSFDPITDMYQVELDWRPLSVQVSELTAEEKKAGSKVRPRQTSTGAEPVSALETVVEMEEHEEVVGDDNAIDKLEEEVGVQTIDLDPKDEMEIEEAGIPRVVQVVEKSPQSIPGDQSQTEATTPDGDSVTTRSTSGSNEAQEEPVLPTLPPGSLVTVKATVQSRCITKYVPPSLPKIDKGRGSLFSFWTPGAKKPAFKAGDLCETPYGPGKVVEYREKREMYVVEMQGWKAMAYLRELDVKQPGRTGMFGTLLRQFSTKDGGPAKPIDFPYAEGTVIRTPFGVATVTKPLPALPMTETPKPGSKAPAEKIVVVAPTPTGTIGLSLTKWKLADGKHPMLYCTVETAREWKDERSSGFFSNFTSLVSYSAKSVWGGSSRGDQRRLLKKEQDPAPLFKQYYQDGAAVTTSFGGGVVQRFRAEDGFYEISVKSWKLANGTHPTAILQKDDISYRIAKGCHEGYPVWTKLGLSGTLASVEPTTGVHIVTIASAGMVCYLQPEFVVRPIKASVGEDVLTAYGEGKVERYNYDTDTYVIRLSGWNATLYAKGETFDRINDGMQDRDGAFGMNWLLRFLFFTSSTTASSKQESNRSRSNSLVSLGRAPSIRSLTG